MTFILAQPTAVRLAFSITHSFQRAEIVQHCHAAAAEHFQVFLRNRSVPVREVADDSQRSIGETESDHHVVLTVLIAVRKPLCADRLRGCPDQMGEHVNEVAGFPDDPASALVRVLGPVRERQPASIYTVIGDKRLLPSAEKLFQTEGQRREAAVETDGQDLINRFIGIFT